MGPGGRGLRSHAALLLGGRGLAMHAAHLPGGCGLSSHAAKLTGEQGSVGECGFATWHSFRVGVG